MEYVWQIGLILTLLKFISCQYGPIKVPLNERTTTPFPTGFQSDNEIYNIPNSGFLSNALKSSELFQNKLDKNNVESFSNQNDNFLPGFKNSNLTNFISSGGAVTALDNPWLKNIISQNSNLVGCNKQNKCSDSFPSCPSVGFGCVPKEQCQDGQTSYRGEQGRQCHKEKEYCCRLIYEYYSINQKQTEMQTKFAPKQTQILLEQPGYNNTHEIFAHAEQQTPPMFGQPESQGTQGTFGHSQQTPTQLGQPGSQGTHGTFGHPQQQTPTQLGQPGSAGKFGHLQQKTQPMLVQPGYTGTFGHPQQQTPTKLVQTDSTGTFGHPQQQTPTQFGQPGSAGKFGHPQQQTPTKLVQTDSTGTFGHPQQQTPTQLGQPESQGTQGTFGHPQQQTLSTLVQPGYTGTFGHPQQQTPTQFGQPGSAGKFGHPQQKTQPTLVQPGYTGTFGHPQQQTPTQLGQPESQGTQGTFGHPQQQTPSTLMQPGYTGTFGHPQQQTPTKLVQTDSTGTFGHPQQQTPTQLGQPGSQGTQGTFGHPQQQTPSTLVQPGYTGTFGHPQQQTPTKLVQTDSTGTFGHPQQQTPTKLVQTDSTGTFGHPQQQTPTQLGQPESQGTQGTFGHPQQQTPSTLVQPGYTGTFGHPQQQTPTKLVQTDSTGTFGHPQQQTPTQLGQPGSQGTQGTFGHPQQQTPSTLVQPGYTGTFGHPQQQTPTKLVQTDSTGTFGHPQQQTPTKLVQTDSTGTFGHPQQQTPTQLGQPESQGTQGTFGHPQQQTPSTLVQPGYTGTFGHPQQQTPTKLVQTDSTGTFGHPQQQTPSTLVQPGSAGKFGHPQQQTPTKLVQTDSTGTFGHPQQQTPTQLGQPGSAGKFGHPQQKTQPTLVQPGYTGTFSHPQQQTPTKLVQTDSTGTFGHPQQQTPTQFGQPGSAGKFGHPQQQTPTKLVQTDSTGTFGHPQQQTPTQLGQPESQGTQGTFGHPEQQTPKKLGQSESQGIHRIFEHTRLNTDLGGKRNVSNYFIQREYGTQNQAKNLITPRPPNRVADFNTPGLHGIPIGGSIYDHSHNPSISVTEVSFKKYTGPLNTTPHIGCAAALKCVEEIYCTWDGVMSDTPLVLTQEEMENKVPLSECQNIETGIIGKCCRDPNYEDPWPSEQSHGVGFNNHSGHQFELNLQGNLQNYSSPGLNFYMAHSFTPTPQTLLNLQARPFKTDANKITQPNSKLLPHADNSPSFSTTSSVFGSNSGIYSASNESTGRPHGPPPGYPFFDLTTLSPSGSILNSAHGTGSFDSGNGCGLRKPVTRPNGANGITTGFGEFPWQAQVILLSDQSPLCSGAIVSERVVVTSAYCINEFRSNDLMVKTGDWKLGINNSLDEPKSFQINLVAAIAKHPNFDPVTRFFDLAVLILSESLNWDSHIGVLCVGEETFQKTKSNNCVVSGWGRENLKGNIAGSILHSISVNFVNAQQCENAFRETFLGKYFQLNKSFGCILPIQANQNLCEVDIGSPIACQKQDGRYELKGIYSWDSGCRNVSNAPAAFADLDTKWLNSVIKKPAEQILEEEKFNRDRIQNISVNFQKSDATKPGFSQGYGK